MNNQIVLKINEDSTVAILGYDKYPFYWIKNTGETTIYATTKSIGEKTVEEWIADYEAGHADHAVKLQPQEAARLEGRKEIITLIAADGGLAEFVADNLAECPFKVAAKGGGKIEALTVNENGTYTASGKTKGYSPVSVNVQPNLGTKNISDNGTYTASTDQLDGYSAVTVAVSQDYYPKAGATLDDVTHVEADDQRVLPMAGADYYPYVYLASYPTGETADFVPCGKQFNGQTEEHTVALFFDLIDTATGESVTGYPQRIAPNWSVSIVNGGYMKVVSWTVKNSGAVSVVTERYNPTYTKPLQDTHDSTAVTGGKLDAYLDTSYYIDGGAGESVQVTTLNVSTNGTYTAPARTAYGTVNVDVQEQPWQPLQDGYSNFWFELTNDTLSPWLNFSAKTEDAVIDWGDGSGEVALDTLTPTHTYAKAGKYVVKVKGVTRLAQQTVTTALEYYGCIKYVELNSEVTALENGAFQQCINLKQCIMPNVSLIGSSAFLYCSDLEALSLSVEVIQTTALRFCFALKNLTLANTTNIGTYNIQYAISLKELTLPSTVINIASSSISNCVSLRTIHLQATTPPILGQTNTFSSLPSNFIIYVPVGTGETYKAATRWSDYADHILEEGQTPNRAMLSRLAKAVETDTDTDTEER